MDQLCFMFKQPGTNQYLKGGCPFTDSPRLRDMDKGRLEATARMLFLEDILGVPKHERLSLKQFNILNTWFPWHKYDFHYWIEEA